MVIGKIFERGIRKNKSTVVSFVNLVAVHNGRLNPKNLFRIKKGELGVELAKDVNPETRSVIIGIEPCNSFSPLYELDYFLMAFFLSTVATALPLATYAKITDDNDRLKKISSDIELITSTDLEIAMQHPAVAIVGILTDDIEPYRYRKDHLWGIDYRRIKKRSIDVSIEELHPSEQIAANDLWVEQDVANAYCAVRNAGNLCEAKMIQSYLSIGKFLRDMGIDIDTIPFFFSMTPNSDIRNLGTSNPFLDLILELHTPRQHALIRRLLRWNYPRILEISCPNCGESSKKVINGQIKGEDKRKVRLVCSEKPKRFTDESGTGVIERKGCNYRWDFVIPSNREELYAALSPGFSLYFPINSLFWVINNLSFAPAALLFTDAGFQKEGDRISVIPGLPIGDHAELLINMAMLQRLFLRHKLCPDVSKDLSKRGMLVNAEPLLIGHQSPTLLCDPALKFNTTDGRVFHVTDSSIFAALGHGLTPEMVLECSFNIVDFPTAQLLRDLSLTEDAL